MSRRPAKSRPSSEAARRASGRVLRARFRLAPAPLRGLAWRSGLARDYAFVADLYVPAGIHLAVADFAWVQDCNGDLRIVADACDEAEAGNVNFAHTAETKEGVRYSPTRQILKSASPTVGRPLPWSTPPPGPPPRSLKR